MKPCRRRIQYYQFVNSDEWFTYQHGRFQAYRKGRPTFCLPHYDERSIAHGISTDVWYRIPEQPEALL